MFSRKLEFKSLLARTIQSFGQQLRVRAAATLLMTASIAAAQQTKILPQDHGDEAAFHNFKIRRLPARKKTAETLFSESRPAMGSTFEIYLYAADRTRAAELFDEAFEEIERIEAWMSNYRESSELSRINKTAERSGGVITDPEVFDFLERALAYSRQSNGAFDPTVGKLIKAWGFFRGNGKFPSDAELAQARHETGWQNVQLNRQTRTVEFLIPGLEFDPGGIGKGYAVDRVADLLRATGVTGALVSSGSSSIYALGAPPGKAGWTVCVPDPLDRNKTVSSVLLRDNSLSTSGNYEKFFWLNDRIYSHIIDPRTARPVQGMLQTTVIAPSAMETDALSTTMFVLGAADGSQLLRNRPETAALFIADRNDTVQLTKLRWNQFSSDAEPEKW